jgi:hypothetical protein
MINSELIVEPRQVYGETRIYPKCEHSKGLAQLLGQTTLTAANVQNLIRLGYTVRAEYAEPMNLPKGVLL